MEATQALTPYQHVSLSDDHVQRADEVTALLCTMMTNTCTLMCLTSPFGWRRDGMERR